jgi:adenylate cyclase
MNTEGVKRKLTAILSADVKGYSRLMSQDEEATVKTLKQHRETISGLILGHRGRVVDAPGDNILAEFGSVVDAVKCAVEIQRALKTKNAGLAEDRRMNFRIGVNLGDVIEEEDRIYGDGVNITARLEGLAEGGGIYISGTAFDHVKNKLPVGYQYVGKQVVKNIPDPVRAYKVLMEPEAVGKVIGEERPKPRKWGWKTVAAGVLVLVVLAGGLVWNFYLRAPRIEPASVDKMAFPLPDKPSIAVLPFVNMSDDPKQQFFSDGITEEIITALAKVPHLFVIARNSTFAYKGKSVNVQKVSEELGVRYVMEGSVRTVGNRVRITGQLIDALTGHHLWAERYDRALKDIFALQDEITMKVLLALEVKLTEGEQARLYGKGTDNLEAYLKVLQGREHKYRFTKEDNALARQMFEEAIALDPEYAMAYRFLAGTHLMDVWFRSTKSPQQSLDRAIELGQKAIALDDSLAGAYGLLGQLYTMKRQHEKGIAEAERAVALDPNSADAHAFLGQNLHYAGRHEEATALLKKAIRLNPIPPNWYLLFLGHAHRAMGRYEDAIAQYKEALHRRPNNLFAYTGLAASYSLSGREEEARVAAGEVFRIQPKFSLEYFAKTLPFKNQADKERYVGALREAGLPERPPLPLPDKPSIAVLPFVNMSGDPKQEYLSDGITESIIMAVSKIHNLFVIARNSTFTYKGKAVKVQQVARELGVQYVLEGSVQRSGERLRITAQLIDALTGRHIWAQRYDRELKDLFAMQDDITMEVLTAMRVKLTEGAQVLRAKRPSNIEAALKAYEAHGYVLRFSPEANAMAKKLGEEVVAMESGWGEGYYILSEAHMMDVWLGTTKSPKESIDRAIELSEKAISLDDSLAQALGLLGYIYGMKREYDKSVAYAEKAVAKDPNGADAHAWLGNCLNFAARPQEAIPHYKKGGIISSSGSPIVWWAVMRRPLPR